MLKSDDGRVMHIRAFSGEVASIIANSKNEEEPQIPSVYRMIEEICEESGLMLVKAKIYKSGRVLRANLYLTGSREIVLRNYRASDAIALGVTYGVPIMVRSDILYENAHGQSE